MSKIKILGLGGFAESGKNMFVVDVDGHLFILDAGLKYPSQEMHGIDEIIPDYQMLTRSKNIEGIFISHAHEDHIGALTHILKDINVPVFATNFSMEIIKDALLEAGFNLEDLTLHTINHESIIRIGPARITFFKTTHSIPESVGIAIHTVDGVIVYTSEFTFEQNKNFNYQTDFKQINELADKKILALLVESVGSSIVSHTNATERLRHQLNSIFQSAPGRIIVSLFSSDLFKIQRTIDISLQNNKKIAIIGRRAQRIVDIAIKSGYLNIPKESLVNLRFIDEKNKNDDKDLVCLVTGNRHEPFYMLQRMCRRQDRLIHINNTDTIVLMTSPVPGTEKMAAKTLDILHRSDAMIERIDRELLSSSHASASEVQLMINLFKPEYVIPCIGEYRHMYHVKKLANEIGYEDDKIILLDNGDVFNIQGEQSFVARDDVKTGEIYIDGSAVGDVNDYVVRDRELLADDGVLILVAHINPVTKKIIGDMRIESKGFFYGDNEVEIKERLEKIIAQISEKHFTYKYINWNELKREIRNHVSRYIYQSTRRSPITIPVIISVDK